MAYFSKKGGRQETRESKRSSGTPTNRASPKGPTECRQTVASAAVGHWGVLFDGKKITGAPRTKEVSPPKYLYLLLLVFDSSGYPVVAWAWTSEKAQSPSFAS